MGVPEVGRPVNEVCFLLTFTRCPLVSLTITVVSVTLSLTTTLLVCWDGEGTDGMASKENPLAGGHQGTFAPPIT